MPPIRVLLIEDNPGDARLAQLALHDMRGVDASVDTVGRLADALTALSASPADVALLDLSLPDSHGVRTVERLRADFRRLEVSSPPAR